MDDEVELRAVRYTFDYSSWFAAGEDGRVYYCDTVLPTSWTMTAPCSDETYYGVLDHCITDFYVGISCLNFVGKATYDSVE